MHTQCVRVSEYMRRAKQSSKKMVGKIRKKKNTDIYEGSLKKKVCKRRFKKLVCKRMTEKNIKEGKEKKIK